MVVHRTSKHTNNDDDDDLSSDKYKECVVVSDGDELNDERFYRKWRRKHAAIGILLSDDSDDEDSNFRVPLKRRKLVNGKKKRRRAMDQQQQNISDSESDDDRIPDDFVDESTLYDSESSNDETPIFTTRASFASSSAAASSSSRNFRKPQYSAKRNGPTRVSAASSRSTQASHVQQRPRGVPLVQRRVDLTMRNKAADRMTSAQRYMSNTTLQNAQTQRSAVPKHLKSQTLKRPPNARTTAEEEDEEEVRLMRQRRRIEESRKQHTHSQLPKNRGTMLLEPRRVYDYVPSSSMTTGASTSTSIPAAAPTHITVHAAASTTTSTKPGTSEATVWTHAYQLNMDSVRSVALSSGQMPPRFDNFERYTYIMKRQIVDCSVQMIESEFDELRFESENAIVRAVRHEQDYLHIYLFAQTLPEDSSVRLKARMKGQYRSEDVILLSIIDKTTSRSKFSFIGRYRSIHNKEILENQLGIYNIDLIIAVKCKPPKSIDIKPDDNLQVRKLGNLEPLRIIYNDISLLSKHPLINFILDASSAPIRANPIEESGDKITSNILAIESGVLAIDGFPGTGRTEMLTRTVIKLCSERNSTRIFIVVPDESCAAVIIHRLCDYEPSLSDSILYNGLAAHLNNTYGLRVREDLLKRKEKTFQFDRIERQKRKLQEQVDKVAKDIAHITSQLIICERDIHRQREILPLKDELDLQKTEERRIRAQIGKLTEQYDNIDKKISLESRREQVLEKFNIIINPIGFTPPKLPNSVDYMFFDNAEEIPEGYSLLPMCRNPCQRLILFGNSKKYDKVGVKRIKSLFERLISNKVPCIPMPMIQYRIRKEIADVLSDVFYRENVPGTCEEADSQHQTTFPNNQHPFLVHDLVDCSPSNSEVHYALELLILWLSQSDYESTRGKVTILCWNRRQRNNLLGLLLNIPYQILHSFFEISTVRDYAAKQNEYIILLGPSRPHPTDHVAYLEDVRKLHMGLTRASQILHVVCNSSRAHQSDIWSRLLQEVQIERDDTDLRYHKAENLSKEIPNSTLNWFAQVMDPRLSASDIEPPELTIDIPHRDFDLNLN